MKLFKGEQLIDNQQAIIQKINEFDLSKREWQASLFVLKLNQHFKFWSFRPFADFFAKTA